MIYTKQWYRNVWLQLHRLYGNRIKKIETTNKIDLYSATVYRSATVAVATASAAMTRIYRMVYGTATYDTFVLDSSLYSTQY